MERDKGMEVTWVWKGHEYGGDTSIEGTHVLKGHGY